MKAISERNPDSDMLRLLLPGEKPSSLAFYLAMEEYAAEHFPEGAFFTWTCEPTVIIGRNQDLASEVNLDYCREHSIKIVRRKSGGGCVYADGGNMMVSLITPERGVEAVFGTFLEGVGAVLRSLCLEAVRTERNDILVDGLKVSGNAFFVHPGGSIVHGTLMLSVNLDALQEAITPSAEKLASHGVKSVRQRVVNLRDKGLTITQEALSDLLAGHFCSGSHLLSTDDIGRIRSIEALYADPAFVFGKEH
ncbi:MAG: lipoate--protein ligase family protein [Bacteroidales bacterium]|nr:lipoate--protein ligase family protein [Bacteroidales bacterium]